MTIRPCPCGRIPSLLRRNVNGISIAQIECTCGKRGAYVMFTKETDRERTEQAVVDGWNLAE